jgi:hypothetical protein
MIILNVLVIKFEWLKFYKSMACVFISKLGFTVFILLLYTKLPTFGYETTKMITVHKYKGKSKLA